MTPEQITAFLTPISVAFLGWLTYLGNKRLKEVHRVAVQVDEAVNGKAKGQSSISQDVTTIKNKQEADSPTETPSSNDGRTLISMVERLTVLVDKLLAEKPQ